MILDVDLGNTRLKWRLFGQAHSGSVPPTAAGIAQVASQCRGVSRIRMASVADQQLTANVRAWLGTHVQVAAEVCAVRRRCGVFETAYDNSRLGVDRWLAVLAAWHHFKSACIVVDAGTAFTVDLVTAAGRHSGGYIVPGYRSMLDTLWCNTSGVKAEPAEDVIDLAPGLSTNDAVNRGVVQMYLGLIERTRAAMQDIPVLVLAGGDASLLRPHLGESRHCPDLVFDGLNIVYPP